MSDKHRLARYIALVDGALLCVLGVLHDTVNIPAFRRATARGDIAVRLSPQVIANVAFGGMALALLGVFLVLIARDLERGRRAAWRIGVVIGLFLVVDGVAAYLWLPKAGVLLFSALGGLICGPLLVWRREFLVE
jgi:hypothetical protein